MFNRRKKKDEERENSNGTFKWKEKTSTNKRQRTMRESLMKIKSTLASLSSVNLLTAVSLPNKPEDFIEDKEKDKDEISEWLAENTVDFYNEVYVLFSFVTEDNKGWTELLENPELYPNKGYPERVKYLWRNTANSKPKEFPVDVYIEHIFVWVDAQIDNEEIFPTEEDVPFPETFKQSILKIYQRLFRVFAIMFSNECLHSGLKVDKTQLKTSLKHFLYFCWKWDLLSEKETKCIDSVVQPIRQSYNRDVEEFQQRLKENKK